MSLGAAGGKWAFNGTLLPYFNGTYYAYSLGGGGGTLVYNPAITGSSSLNITGPGTVELASTANNFTGGTTLDGAQVNLDSATALGNGPLTILGGAIANTSGAAMTLSGVTAQYWNGSFTFAGSNDLNLGTGNVTLGASLTVTVSSNRLTVNGPIGDNGQGYGLTKAGTGTLALGGSSGYSGGTTINAGTLELDANAAAQNSPVTVNVNNGLAFGPGVTSPVVAGLAGSGNVSLITTDSSAVVLNVIGNSTGLPYYGNLTGPGGLAKTGSGTLILAGSNSYTGATTVSGGTLQIGTGGSGEALAISTTSIADNAALVVDCYGALPLSAAISGTGSLTKAGAGADSKRRQLLHWRHHAERRRPPVHRGQRRSQHWGRHHQWRAPWPWPPAERTAP